MRKSVIFAFVFLFLVSSVSAAIVPANSCNRVDIQTAISAASDGDIVEIPAEDCSDTWNTPLEINKEITVQGAGIDQTYLGSNTGSPVFQIMADNVRVTGITFDCNWQNTNDAILTTGKGDGYGCGDNPQYGFVDFRIDHNKFIHCGRQYETLGYRAVGTFGPAYGVIDNNIFIDCNGECITIEHDGKGGRFRSNEPGGYSDNRVVFIEDNTFNYTTANEYGVDNVVESNGAARFVVRYNKVNLNNDEGMTGMVSLHDCSTGGNCHGYDNADPQLAEVYGNEVFCNAAGRLYEFFTHRAGRAFVYNNTVYFRDLTRQARLYHLRAGHRPSCSNPSYDSHTEFCHEGAKGEGHITDATTLVSDIDSTQTTGIIMASTAGFPTDGSGSIIIDGEQIDYTGYNGNELTGVTRGAGGDGVTGATINVPHTSGSSVELLLYGVCEGQPYDSYYWNNGYKATLQDNLQVRNNVIVDWQYTNLPNYELYDIQSYTQRPTNWQYRNDGTPYVYTPYEYPHPLRNELAENAHYVSPTGTASWSECQNINTPCSLDTANQNAVAGDTVYLRGGTYSSQSIQPSNSGTSGNKITFAAYPGETPILDDTGETVGTPYGYGVLINRINYIVIDGITIQNQEYPVAIYHGASYNEIKNCIIHDSLYIPGTSSGSANLIIIRDGQGDEGGCTHNWIHNNTLYRAGHIGLLPGNLCYDIGGIMIVGSMNSDYISHYNTIEDNVMYHGGHYVLQTNTKYNVIRNNIMHNEGFMPDDNPNCDPITQSWDNTGLWGNRVMAINDGNGQPTINNIIENNRVGFGGNPPDGGGANGIVMTGRGNIVRYNYVFEAGEKGIYCKQLGGGMGDSDNNRIYNNDVYHGGYSYGELGNTAFSAIFISANSDQNVIKNNLVYGTHPSVAEINNGVTPDNTVENNWLEADGDPLFVNPDVSDPMSLTLPDLSLQQGSGAIDSGVHLTNVASSDTGTGNILHVNDALYFQDGTWGSAISDVRPDWIAVGSVDNVVQISSIDYDNNIITLNSDISRVDGDPIWLYKDSTGKQVLYGSAPDIGAYEYLQTAVYHEADTNVPFGVIDITELMTYVTAWKYGDGSILMGNVVEAISHWKAGSYN